MCGCIITGVGTRMRNSQGHDHPTVIVPVHNAPEHVRWCLVALAATLPADAPVHLLDDASTDPAVAPLLQRASDARSTWRLTTLDSNQGFVATVNLAMSAAEGDVVLLNSDTQVTPGWYQALSVCLASDPAIATATPWSNNGEIVSLPAFCRNQPPPPQAAAVGRAIHDIMQGRAGYPELPTAVGFCMAISRHALDHVGLFDADRFGLGYGEENDFSRRAIAAGLRNVLCDDAYVVHHGGKSFGPRGLAPDQQAMDRVLERHPDYLQAVGEFIEADPLAARRDALVRQVSERGLAWQ